MEVAVLHPHDCLKSHHHHRRPLISPPRNPNPNRSNRRRRNSPPPQHQTRPKSPPVLGQVRILKRGEDINLSPPSPPSPPPVRRFITGPIIDGFYAGSAFVTSPPPSELPLPGFCTRRSCGGEAHNQEIASELRRVLKLQI